MAQIEHNLISADEIALFKQYYNTFSTEKYVNATTDDHLMVDQGPIIDHRLLIEPSKSQQCWDIVQRVTHHFLPGCENIWETISVKACPTAHMWTITANTLMFLPILLLLHWIHIPNSM